MSRSKFGSGLIPSGVESSAQQSIDFPLLLAGQHAIQFGFELRILHNELLNNPRLLCSQYLNLFRIGFSA